MSLYDYQEAKKLAEQDVTFYALIMAAMRRADSRNALKLQFMYPRIWEELDARYHAPGGRLEKDDEADTDV